jgi:hypothetical protein
VASNLHGSIRQDRSGQIRPVVPQKTRAGGRFQ